MGIADFCFAAKRYYIRHFKKGRNVLIFGRLFTTRCQIFDVLRTFCGPKYGRLDVIQNPVRWWKMRCRRTDRCVNVMSDSIPLTMCMLTRQQNSRQVNRWSRQATPTD